MIVPYKLPQTAGNEVVGIVESIGKKVNNFQIGDRVFGRLPLDHIGAFAEYLAVDTQALAKFQTIYQTRKLLLFLLPP